MLLGGWFWRRQVPATQSANLSIGNEIYQGEPVEQALSAQAQTSELHPDLLQTETPPDRHYNRLINSDGLVFPAKTSDAASSPSWRRRCFPRLLRQCMLCL